LGIGDIRMIDIKMPVLRNKGYFEFKLLPWILPVKGNPIMPFYWVNPEIMKDARKISKCFDKNFVPVTELTV